MLADIGYSFSGESHNKGAACNESPLVNDANNDRSRGGIHIKGSMYNHSDKYRNQPGIRRGNFSAEAYWLCGRKSDGIGGVFAQQVTWMVQIGKLFRYISNRLSGCSGGGWRFYI